MSKTRLDQLLVDKNLIATRNEAQRLIRTGKVLVKETVIDKPGTKIPDDDPIRILVPESPYVSRGGLKLEGALDRFQLDVSGWVAADLGASTGGFTDCLLHRGVDKVFAVDVGRGQLAYKLQIDPRVVVMDQTNTRHLTQEDLGESVDLVVADLSFISIKTVFPAIQRIVKPAGCAVLLIKPQFEIGKGRVGKKGIVRNLDDHVEVLEGCRQFLVDSDWTAAGVVPSPITGKTGNIEFFLYGKPNRRSEEAYAETTDAEGVAIDCIRAAVREAHERAGRSDE